MVAGGYDALTTWLDVLGFTLLGALTDGLQRRPRARLAAVRRATGRGFVLGEGAVALVLEDLDAARARGATVLAEITGYGSSLNAYRITDAPPDGSGPITRCDVPWRSRLAPGDVDCIVAHGTSTPGNDVCETTAIKEVFGADAYRLVVTSPKSMTGHSPRPPAR